jgi:hypothetical protein
MQFQPKTQEDIIREQREFAEKNVLPKGEYDFEVMAAEDAVSKRTGKEMIKLTLKVWGLDGKERSVTDYLLGAMEHKLYHFAHATGLGEQYRDGGLEAIDCEGRSGRVKLKVESSDQYGTKNAVVDYVAEKPKEAAPAPALKAKPPVDPDLDAPEEDDIPF